MKNKSRENQKQIYFLYLITKFRNISLLAGLAIIFGIMSGGLFLSPKNLINILMRASIVGIVAIGQTLVLFSGGIDLSVGSLFSFSLVMNYVFLQMGYSPLIAAILGILVTMLVGIINGVLVVQTKVPAFIITLSTMMMLGSINLTIVGAKAMMFAETKNMIEGLTEGIPMGFDLLPIFVWLILSLIVSQIMINTSYGYNLYALGGKETTAKYSGVNVKVVKSSVYVFSAFFAATAAFFYIYRLSNCKPDVGSVFLIQSIAASVIGGASLFGGEGNVMGTIIGAIIMVMTLNFMNIMRIDPYIQTIIQGIILIAAVFGLGKLANLERFLSLDMLKSDVDTKKSS